MKPGAIVLGCIFCTFASGQELPKLTNLQDFLDFPVLSDPFQTDDGVIPETDKPIDNYVLRPKPWWLRATTKKWQWVTFDPKIYYPPHLSPLEYPAIIAHEKVHLSQQRKKGKYRWLFRYITSKKFRFEQEMEPIIEELSHLPLEKRKRLAEKYAQDLASSPYSRAAKSYEIALEGIMSKASEMGVEL